MSKTNKTTVAEVQAAQASASERLAAVLPAKGTPADPPAPRGRKQQARPAPRGPPTVPTSFHLDKRAGLLASTVAGGDDDLLTTPQTAAWLGVSIPWLEIGRSRGYGPPFERLSPKLIRYRRGAVRGWLDKRRHRCTAEYGSP